MKRPFIMILVGILLLGAGIFLYLKRPSPVMTPKVDNTLSKEEAISIVTEKINEIIAVYENPKTLFQIEEEENGLKVNNYQEVIATILSENGKKQLESTEFRQKKYVTMNENSTYFLKEIPSSSRYQDSKVTFGQVTIKNERIEVEVTFSSYDVKEDGVINYYVITKNIKVIKKDKNWLIEDFKYNNE